MHCASAFVLVAAVLEGATGTGRVQRGGEHAAAQQAPDFPEYHLNDHYSNLVMLSTEGKDFENRVVDAITEEKVMKTLEQLTALGSEPSLGSSAGHHSGRSWSNPEDTDISVTWLQKQFGEMGFQQARVCLQHFVEEGVTLTNVVAFEDAPGAQGSVTLGAHYDSRPFTGEAPGANDNGSGVAALVEIARAFKAKLGQQRLHKPVYFVAFAGEEAGLFGSKHFAKALKNAQDTSLPASCRSESGSVLLRGSSPRESSHEALIMDEIGWVSSRLDQETVNMESFDTPETKSILDDLAQSNADHNVGLEVIHSDQPFGSDHMSWSDEGFPSVLSINGDDEQYPNYHKSSDSLEAVSGDLLAKVARMNAGALVRMAGPEASGSEMKAVQKHM